MFYYFIPRTNKFYNALKVKGDVLKDFKSGSLIITRSAIKGQSHYLVDDPQQYLNPSHFKDYWHLREALPYDVRKNIEVAEESDPDVKTIMGDMKSAPVLDREDVAFIQGVAVLQLKGLLTQEQANDLLSYEDII